MTFTQLDAALLAQMQTVHVSNITVYANYQPTPRETLREKTPVSSIDSHKIHPGVPRQKHQLLKTRFQTASTLLSGHHITHNT